MAGPVQWGTVGEWVSGIGSLVAVGSALWLARRAEVIARSMREDDRAQFARVEASKLTVDFSARVAEREGLTHTRWTMKVENTSLHPFTDLTATGRLLGVDHAAKAWRAVPPIPPMTFGGAIPLDPPVSVKPGADVRFSVTVHRTVDDPAPSWTLEFSDIEGFRWEATDRGGLRRVQAAG